MNKFSFLKVLFSPFKPFGVKFYIGKVSIGTPYFFPRKWVKATPKLAHNAALKEIKNEESFNRRNPNYARKIKDYGEIYQEKLRYKFAVPKKIGFDFVSLGWKTKWSGSDYRFEWAPIWSFVFLKWQIALIFIVPEQSHYWEAWLYYERDTDKSKTKRERIDQCMKDFSLKCIVYKGGNEEHVDYYKLVLKERYLK